METGDLKQLIQKAKEGDCDSFGKIYSLFFTPVYRYLYLRLHDKSEAEDLSQIVFTKVFKAIDCYREEGKPFLAYLFTVARNTLVDYWRKTKEIPSDDLENGDFGNIEEEIINNDRIGRLKKCLSQLTPDQREVITLRFISDLPTREVAKILGKSEEAIRQVQCRALKALKNILKIDPV